MSLPVRLLTLVLSAAACLLGASTTAGAQEMVDIIVKRDAGLSRAERADIRAQAGVRFERASTIKDVELVNVPADKARAALAELNADSDVEFAELNTRARAQELPPFRVAVNDPFLSEQYSIHNYGQPVSGGTYTSLAGADMRVRHAWNLVSDPARSVRVAIIDTGVEMTHPDLEGQFWTNPAETPGNGVDDDANGFIDDISGWDFAGDDNNPSHADNGHGTHVAGIVGATRNNALGIAGVAPDSRLVPLRVLGSDGSGGWLDVAEALDYAGQMGFEVANASLGGYGTLSIIDEAIAPHTGTLYVFAAGNNGRDLDTTTFYPCESPQPQVACVAATDLQNQLVSWSNYSPSGEAVDIAAPGLNVYSTVPGDSYTWMAGTSMASPNVAGAGALVLATGADLSGAELKEQLMSTARELSSPRGSGAGMTDALAAVRSIVQDSDNDGLFDGSDSCPTTYGSTASGCPDSDGDGVIDSADNCPAVSNPAQTDTDEDGSGDACDPTPLGPDGDGDGVLDQSDNCPNDSNSGQRDADGDGAGDACDETPRGADTDGDGVPALDDNCPTRSGPASNKGCPVVTDTPSSSPPVTSPPASGPSPVTPPVEPSPGTGQPTVPSIEKLAVKVRERRVTVSLAASQDTGVTVKMERKRCSRSGKCRYRQVGSYQRSLTAGTVEMVRFGKLAGGAYRVTATIEGQVQNPAARSFKVR